MEKAPIQLRTLVNNLPVDPEQSSIPIILTGDRVLIEPFNTDDTLANVKTQDGSTVKLVKPVNHQEDYKAGRIVAVGPGYPPDFMVPAAFKPGVVVNYFYQRGIPFDVDKKLYDAVRANDVIMIL